MYESTKKSDKDKSSESQQNQAAINQNISLRKQEAHVIDQRKTAVEHREIQKKTTRKQNKTGLPDNLKSGIENLSGQAVDDVRVHYNSDKPAQLQAHAYAQGNEIHLASGQEKYLPHEAWHVVQQKQGRVKPTMRMTGGVNVNDDAGLEKEADLMGTKALHSADSHEEASPQRNLQKKSKNSQVSQLQPIVQRGAQGSRPARAVFEKKVVYQMGQMSNTTLAEIIKGNFLKSRAITHGTQAQRDILRGEMEAEKKTNPGTTGEYVHFYPSWRNEYGNYVYVFDKEKLAVVFKNGEYRQSGEVSTALSEGYYTKAQLKNVEERLLFDKPLEKD